MSRAGAQVRIAVQEAGGRLEMTVRDLRDAFEVSRLTRQARARIAGELRGAAIETEPPLGDLPLGARIALVDVRPLSPAATVTAHSILPAPARRRSPVESPYPPVPRPAAPPELSPAPAPAPPAPAPPAAPTFERSTGPRPAPAPAVPASRPAVPAPIGAVVRDEEPDSEWEPGPAPDADAVEDRPAERLVAATIDPAAAAETAALRARRRRTRTWRAAVVVGVLAGSLVALLIAVTGFADRNATAARQTPMAPEPPAAAPAALTPAQVEGLIERAEAALLADDPAAARAALDRIGEAPASAEPPLAAELTRVRGLVEPTERYIAATALGASGDYLAAREAMLALVPFRQSEAAARSYTVRAAQGLVAEARGLAGTDRARARELLRQAEGLAPELTALDDLRATLGD